VGLEPTTYRSPHAQRGTVYRAVDHHGQLIDVYVSGRRDIPSARTFLTKALGARQPCEVITDRSPALANVIEDLLPAANPRTDEERIGRDSAAPSPARDPNARAGRFAVPRSPSHPTANRLSTRSLEMRWPAEPAAVGRALGSSREP